MKTVPNIQPSIKFTGWQKRYLKQMDREKPPAPTLVGKPTLRNLVYLQRRVHIAPILSTQALEQA